LEGVVVIGNPFGQDWQIVPCQHANGKHGKFVIVIVVVIILVVILVVILVDPFHGIQK